MTTCALCGGYVRHVRFVDGVIDHFGNMCSSCAYVVDDQAYNAGFLQ